MGISTVGAESRQFCSECGRPYSPEDIVRFGDAVVCAECKPAYVQRMREGGQTALTGVRYGGFWRRFLAVLIDAILLEIVLIPAGWLLATPLRTDIYNSTQNPLGVFGAAVFSSFFSLATLVFYAVQFAYYVYFISQKGATLGKMMMGVKVVTAAGGPVSVGRAAGRYFAQILSGLVLCIGFIMAAFDSQKRALHDYICSTRVIRD